MLPASEVSAPFGMRIATVGMCSKESGIERRRMFMLAPKSIWMDSNANQCMTRSQRCQETNDDLAARTIMHGKEQLVRPSVILERSMSEFG